MKKIIFIVSLTFLLFSCTQKQKESNVDVTSLSSLKKEEIKNDVKVSVADVKGNSENNGQDHADVKQTIAEENGKSTIQPDKVKPEVIKKKIIKDGRLGLQVVNLQNAKQKIDSLVKSVGGYYANENLKNSDNQSGYELVIRIPALNFERFVGSAEKGSSKVLYKEIQARDVTEEYVDLESRLFSKRNSLARYNEIMKKANSVKDIIEIEESIRALQEEIESTEGRLRYMNDCVDYSTLNMTISTEKDFTFKPAKRDSFWEKLKESIADGWYGLVDFILDFFSLWPYLILILPVVFFIRRWIKKWKLRKKNEKR
jgi:uncharacterized small protein (DUF1192 family)